MRWFFTLLLLVVFACTGFSQIGFGPEAGIGMSSMRFAPLLQPVDYTAASTGAIASGKIGALMDVPLNRHIYFQTGLYFSRRGAVRDFSYYQNDSFNATVHQELDIYYFDLPLNVLYKSGEQGMGRFIAGIGATPSYIIGGKNKLQEHQVFNDTLSNSNGVYPVSIGNTIKGFDIGVNLLAGYELSTGLFFRAYYTIGVSDIGLGTEIDKNRIWGISAGYIFGKGRNVKKDADDLIDKTMDQEKYRNK
jgi:hypothetical protein